MGWREYLESRRKRYTFEDLGCPDFWVELRPLLTFPYGEIKDLIAAAACPLASEEDTEAAIEVAEKLLVNCIVDWNLPDPETGAILPLPKQDMSVLKRSPGEFIFSMQKWLIEEASTAVPPVSGT